LEKLARVKFYGRYGIHNMDLSGSFCCDFGFRGLVLQLEIKNFNQSIIY